MEPCRYCGAETGIRWHGRGMDAVGQMLNTDGTDHHCRERERAQAIPIIYGTEVDKACEPKNPKWVMAQLELLYDYGANGGMAFDGEDMIAVHAAIEVIKLVTRK